MGTDPARWCQTPTCLRIMSLTHVHILFICRTLFLHGVRYQRPSSSSCGCSCGYYGCIPALFFASLVLPDLSDIYLLPVCISTRAWYLASVLPLYRVLLTVAASPVAGSHQWTPVYRVLLSTTNVQVPPMYRVLLRTCYGLNISAKVHGTSLLPFLGTKFYPESL